MRFLLKGEMEGDSEHWPELFDFICVHANKPDWFTSSMPFRSLNPLTKKLRWLDVDSIRPGHVYVGGSFSELDRITAGGFGGQKVAGEGGTGQLHGLCLVPLHPNWSLHLIYFWQVLYLGDHVFSDLSQPQRIGWRTGAIIKELEREVELQLSDEYRALLSGLSEAERLMRSEQVCHQCLLLLCVRYFCSHGVALQVRKATSGAGGQAVPWRLAQVMRERAQLLAQMQGLFNKQFGSEFRCALCASEVSRWCSARAL